MVPAQTEEKSEEDDGFGDFDDFQAFEGQPPPTAEAGLPQAVVEKLRLPKA